MYIDCSVNGKDKNLGPGPDNFMGYECGLLSGPLLCDGGILRLCVLAVGHRYAAAGGVSL